MAQVTPNREVLEEYKSTQSWTALILLMLMYAIALMDRQILSLMVTPLKHEFNLSDVEIGLLQGIAFTVFYAVAGLPIGWAIDRFSRRWIIFGGIFLWSLSCAGGGLAATFGWLFISRLGVGIGEAALLPGAYSMLGDIFPRRRLPLVLGIFAMGGPLGLLISFVLGGFIISSLSDATASALPFAPWRVALVLAGLPGLLLSFLIFTIPEPLRRPRAISTQPFFRPLIDVFKASPKATFTLFAGFGCNTLLAYSIMAWSPVFFERQFGWDSGRIGMAFGLSLGIGGIFGPLVSGAIANRLFRRGASDAAYRCAIFAYIGIIPVSMVAYLTDNPTVSLASLTITYFLTAAIIPQATTSLQLIVPGSLRGRLSAVYLLITSLVGQGLGPLLVALIAKNMSSDPLYIGPALSVVIAGSSGFGAIMLIWGLSPFRALVESENRLDADAVAIAEAEKSGKATTGDLLQRAKQL